MVFIMYETINVLINWFFSILFYVFFLILILFLIFTIKLRYKGKVYPEEIMEVNEEKRFNLWIETLKDLQPLAFFISTSLILAGFLKDDPIPLSYALFSALLLMLAYLEFASYKIKKNSLNFYTGVLLIFIAIGSLVNSFGGIASIISNISNEEFFVKSIIFIGFVYIIRFNIVHLAKLRDNQSIYDIRFYSTTIMLILIITLIIGAFLGFFSENELIGTVALILVIILFSIILFYNDIYGLIKNIKKIYFYLQKKMP